MVQLKGQINQSATNQLLGSSSSSGIIIRLQAYLSTCNSHVSVALARNALHMLRRQH